MDIWYQPEKQSQYEWHRKGIYNGGLTLHNYESKLNNPCKNVASTSGVGPEVGRTGSKEGKMDLY